MFMKIRCLTCSIYLVDERSEPLYFADVCAGPGGFSEYVLWKKKWQAGILICQIIDIILLNINLSTTGYSKVHSFFSFFS